MITQKYFQTHQKKTDITEHNIILTSDSPVRVELYPMPLLFRKQVNEEIKDLLKYNITEELAPHFC